MIKSPLHCPAGHATRTTRRATGAVLFGMALVFAACADREPGLTATGTIEITQVDVAAMVPARVLRVLADEGSTVRAGDTLALLTQTALPADLDQRRARVQAAEADLRDLLQGARPAELERALADVRSAESDAERAAREADRLSRLAEAGGMSQSALDAARSAATVAASRRDAAREVLTLLREGARPERVEAARAAVRTARASLAMAEAAAADLVLTAPADGVVLGRYVEPGEVLGAGVPALSLGDPRRARLRVYVSAPVLAGLRTGQRATVTLEGVGGRTFGATVAALATRSEFTPRVALTERERADLLFAVTLDVRDTTGMVKAGLPATVLFDTTRTPGGAGSIP